MNNNNNGRRMAWKKSEKKRKINIMNDANKVLLWYVQKNMKSIGVFCVKKKSPLNKKIVIFNLNWQWIETNITNRYGMYFGVQRNMKLLSLLWFDKYLLLQHNINVCSCCYYNLTSIDHNAM